jgi:hypothetical protein
MNYTFENDSYVVIYILNVIKTGSGIENLVWEIDRHKERSDLISLL